MPDDPRIELPPNLAVLRSEAGGHRRALKILVYGPAKSGKSFLLASMPGPIFALSCGDSGIEPYLDKGRGDECLNIHSGAALMEATEFIYNLGPRSPWRSIAIDNVNLGWEDYSDDKADELGVEEIRGGLWKKVKGPWRAMVRKLMRSDIHVGMSAWIKDIVYVQEGGTSTMEGKTKIYEADLPQVEKTILYAPDLVFKTDFVRDQKFKPTQYHQVIFYGGRRPRTVPPSELYTGRVWKFDSKNPANVWDTVVGPFLEKWTDGAVDFLGIDPSEAMVELRAMRETEMNERFGRVMALIEAQKTLPELAKVFEGEVTAEYKFLDDDRRKAVLEAKERKKEALQAK